MRTKSLDGEEVAVNGVLATPALKNMLHNLELHSNEGEGHIVRAKPNTIDKMGKETETLDRHPRRENANKDPHIYTPKNATKVHTLANLNGPSAKSVPHKSSVESAILP